MRVGLLGCVRSKRASASPAKDLYTSPLFAGGCRAVEADCDRWFILSAKHGLLAPGTVVEPYDQTLATVSHHHRRSWSARVLADLRRHLGDVGAHTFEIHAGAVYYGFGLRQGLEDAGAEVVVPTEGLSLGRKLAYYASQASNRPGSAEPREPKTAATPAPGRSTGRPQAVVAPPTGKYRLLFQHLAGLTADRWQTSFTEIEKVLCTALPPSARKHHAWWANEAGSHSHARAWLAAGFYTSQVRPDREQVTFRRMDR